MFREHVLSGEWSLLTLKDPLLTLPSRYDLQPAEPIAPVEEADSTSTPLATPATAATLAVPSPTAPRDRTSFRSRLREVHQSAHTGPEYISALRHLHHDHERIRGADVTPQEPRPT